MHPGNARLERHAVYTFNARYAATWRAGRVLLAGDAAHLMPPFAGQGMCSGVRDAANLAWKLDAVLGGHASDALLECYQAERLPSVRTAIDFSMELGKVICVPDPADAAARDAAMAASVGPEPAPAPGLPDIDAGLIHPTAPHAGRQMVQGRIAGQLVDDVHGVGWRLLTVDPGHSPSASDSDSDSARDSDGEIDPAALAWFAELGGQVVTLADPGPTHARWFAEHHTTHALQRPDFYLYGTAATASAASALLDDLRRHLTQGALP